MKRQPSRGNVKRSAAGLAVAAMLGAACGSSSTSDTTSQSATSGQQASDQSTSSAEAETGSQTEATTASTASSPEGGFDTAGESREAVLALARETLDGSQLAVDQFAGKDVLVWFWAPW